VPTVELSAVKELVRTEMSGAFPLDPPLAVDVGSGENWSSAKA
jgi:DNA polymerase I-like protein with 3'-5' exonuclease and polymerase domains